MIHNFKGIQNRIFCLIFVIIHWSSNCFAESHEEIPTHQINVTSAKFGEYCFFKTCLENQICDENFICQCLPGYRVYNDYCIPLAGEFENCTRQEDCSGRLFCINGICRRPIHNDEFIGLAKICLGITVTTIIIAAFSSLIKCVIRKNNPQPLLEHSDTSNGISTDIFHRHVHPAPTYYEVRDEKPPSYEECIRSSEPPPYVISTNPTTVPVERTIQPTNLPVVSPRNETPLSVHNFVQNNNSQVIKQQY